LRNRKLFAGVGAGLVAALAIAVGLAMASAESPTEPPSTTPIKHVVVIFDENVSFDHYFGTYPNATNPPGEPTFTPLPGTPSVNGLSNTLLTDNPNLSNPARLDRSEAVTCDQDHAYGAEQEAADKGLMDRFVQSTAGGGCVNKAIVMDYYDGNTVTGLWNYAQHYALNDNSFGTVYGPSSPGAINLISGDNGGASSAAPISAIENGTLNGDADPTYDDCSGSTTAALSGKNVGNLLNEHHITWGWFEGGFTPTETKEGKAVCGSSHVNVAGATVTDYIQHHEPFQYYASTANPHHLPPTSEAAVGETDQANHQYDLSYFYETLKHGNMPAVSFLKAAAYEDGHAGYSDPLDEQRFLTNTINQIESSPDWSSTAIVIAYDDSDGWYDHVMGPIVRHSESNSDALTGIHQCGSIPATPPVGFENDRCGFGPRLPLLVISPWAKQNYVDNTLTDQSSVLKFIEDNWELGRIGGGSTDAVAGSLGNMFDFNSNDPRAPKLLLDETTGEVVSEKGGKKAAVEAAQPAVTGQPEGAQGSPSGQEGSSSARQGAPGGQGSGGSTGSGSAGKSSAKVSCKASSHGKRIHVSCTLPDSGSNQGREALRLRIARGGDVLASSSTLVHGTHASLTLSSGRTLPPGRYTLRIALDSRQAGVSGANQTVKLG
jgi:phospholipase C